MCKNAWTTQVKWPLPTQTCWLVEVHREHWYKWYICWRNIRRPSTCTLFQERTVAETCKLH